MKHIIFQGTLADKFGSEWHMKAKTLKEVFNCIEANNPSFRKYIIDSVNNGTNFSIQVGEEFLGEEELHHPLSSDTLIISDVPTGAKGGKAKLIAAVILAVVIVASGGFFSAQGGWAVAKGAEGAVLTWKGSAAILATTTLAQYGLQQLLAPDPSVDEGPENYLFNGPANTVSSGQPIPYLFGRKIVGGVPISSDIRNGNFATRTRPAAITTQPSNSVTAQNSATTNDDENSNGVIDTVFTGDTNNTSNVAVGAGQDELTGLKELTTAGIRN
jgi:predicted phage tail protein